MFPYRMTHKAIKMGLKRVKKRIRKQVVVLLTIIDSEPYLIAIPIPTNIDIYSTQTKFTNNKS